MEIDIEKAIHTDPYAFADEMYSDRIYAIDVDQYDSPKFVIGKFIDSQKNNNLSDKLLFKFVNGCSEEYKKNTDIRRIVIDYISGQTDKFFLNECKENLKIVI